MATQRRRVPVRKDNRPAPPREDGMAMTKAEAEPERPDPTCDCPRLEHSDWHEVESDWREISFVKGALNAVMGVPIGYGGARLKLLQKATKAGAGVPADPMLLIGPGRMRRPFLLEAEGLDPRRAYRPGGVAFSRLASAPMGGMKAAVKATVAAASVRYGRKPDRVWIWYLTCAICSGPRDFETLIIAHYRKP